MNAQPPQILIVDDEPLNIEVLADVVSELGEILFATDGRTALEMCAEHRPDIVLLDIMMPEMDGYEVCRRLKEDQITADIPVMFVTALTSAEDEVKGIEMGAVDFIAKPIVAPIVLARIRNQLQLKKYRDHLENIAYIDGLTTIPNRRHFDNTLTSEWQRALRKGETLSILLLDIDFFKKYNDSLGHIAGDECLKSVAKGLSDITRRPADLVARYGGEEFVCLLPETTLDGAAAFADKLLVAVRALNIPHPDSDVAPIVTISIGGASVEITPDADPTKLIEAADANLYAAKQQGRNRAVCT